MKGYTVMDYLALIGLIWLLCGLLAFVLGITMDLKLGLFHYHTRDSMAIYLMICVLVGPYAILHVIGQILDYH
jgi:hypothetical protein